MRILKLALRLLAHGRPDAEREAIQAAIDNPKLLAKIKAKLIELNGGKPFDGSNVVKLLQLLVKYAPEIISLIMRL